MSIKSLVIWGIAVSVLFVLFGIFLHLFISNIQENELEFRITEENCKDYRLLLAELENKSIDIESISVTENGIEYNASCKDGFCYVNHKVCVTIEVEKIWTKNWKNFAGEGFAGSFWVQSPEGVSKEDLSIEWLDENCESLTHLLRVKGNQDDYKFKCGNYTVEVLK